MMKKSHRRESYALSKSVKGESGNSKGGGCSRRKTHD